jgi:nicotinamide-nucleotide amidase
VSDAALRAALVAVGDELLSGATTDTNSSWLARELARLGIPVESVEVVGDDERALAEAIDRARARAGLVTVTGGLGPTLDDVTRHGVARAVGRELLEDADALAEVRAWFDGRKVPMSESNRRQALMPAGAVRLRNRAGTAPGFRVDLDAGAILVLPGPPRELAVVWKDEVVPWLCEKGYAGRPLDEARFHLFGVPESVFAERVGEWMARDADPRMGCTVREGVLTATLRARERSAESRAALGERARELRARFAAEIFSEDEWDLEVVLGRALLERKTTIALAESCTGGLVAGLLTRVPGISAVFGQGHVVYSDDAKERLLGVPRALLATHGAVSREVAEAMALGAARAAGADLAVAVTGIAGPGGGTAQKPVGLVCFATVLAGEAKSVERRFPPVDRDAIRRWSARTALFLAWKRLFDAGRARPSVD